MAKVRLPDNCYGLDMQDGRKYTGRPGSVIEVEPRHARAIDRNLKGDGIMSADPGLTLGTKGTQVCTNCQPSRRWNAWSTECPRCGAPTVKELL